MSNPKPKIPRAVSKYMASIGSAGGKKGSVEDKKRASALGVAARKKKRSLPAAATVPDDKLLMKP